MKKTEEEKNQFTSSAADRKKNQTLGGGYNLGGHKALRRKHLRGLREDGRLGA